MLNKHSDIQFVHKRKLKYNKRRSKHIHKLLEDIVFLKYDQCPIFCDCILEKISNFDDFVFIDEKTLHIMQSMEINDWTMMYSLSFFMRNEWKRLT